MFFMEDTFGEDVIAIFFAAPISLQILIACPSIYAVHSSKGDFDEL